MFILPPLAVQRKLVERVTAVRAEIASERAAAAQLRQTIAADGGIPHPGREAAATKLKFPPPFFS